MNRKLNALLSELEQLPDDEDGEPWSIFLALHPDPNRPRLSDT